ncbi:MAG: signal peptidase I [Clostridiales bacterium]|nr:signal peptidase I [Clostridiales bacterium]
MAQTFTRRRRKLQRKIKAMRIPHKILMVTGIVLGFVLAVFLGVMAGKLFGMKVIVDGDSMAPAIAENEAVRVNKLIYKVKKPGRMDVIVFNMGKNDTSRYYVRRVVGLPGETVQIVDGVIYINDEPVEYKYNSEYIEDPGLCEEPVTLGDNEYFVLGDNYNHCEDSRFGAVGNIDKNQIVGKAG